MVVIAEPRYRGEIGIYVYTGDSPPQLCASHVLKPALRRLHRMHHPFGSVGMANDGRLREARHEKGTVDEEAAATSNSGAATDSACFTGPAAAAAPRARLSSCPLPWMTGAPGIRVRAGRRGLTPLAPRELDRPRSTSGRLFRCRWAGRCGPVDPSRGRRRPRPRRRGSRSRVRVAGWRTTAASPRAASGAKRPIAVARPGL